MKGPKKSEKELMRGNVIRRAAGLGLSLPLLLAGPTALAALDLGPAADFAVFQMGTPTAGGSWSSSSATINGDVGFRATSPGGGVTTVVNGNVVGPNASPPGWNRSGTYSQVPDATLQAIAQQGRDFSAAAVAAGVGLPNIGSISGSGSYTFSAANLAEPGTYIVNATGVSMGNNVTFTLNGSALPGNSRVIVNVMGNWNSTGGSGNRIALVGLDPSQVLFNLTGNSSGSGSGAMIPGTFLEPNSTFSIGSSGMVISGSLIAQSVSLPSGITISGIPFIPEPSSVIAAGLLLIPFGVRAMRVVRKG